MNNWLIDGLKIVIHNMTLSGYLSFMFALFVLALTAIIFWYKRAQLAHKLVINFLKHHDSYNEKKDSEQRNSSSTEDNVFIHVRKLNDWLQNTKPLKKKIIYKELIHSCQSYYDQFQVLYKSGESLVPDVYDFFLEENLVHKYGKRKLVDVVPGIFVSLGILGTFMGLIAGLNDLIGPDGRFVSTDSDAVLGGIGGLINGMTVAFYSSILGIILSLLWQFLDKFFFYPSLMHSFQQFRQELDNIFSTQAEESFLQQLVRNQKQHLEDFQTFMSERLIPQMVSGYDDALKNVLEPYLQQTNEMIQQTLEQSSQSQLQGINKMVDHFVNSLHDKAGYQMKQLGVTLEKSVEWQEKVYHEMTQLVESMQQAAKEQSLMVEKTTRLTEQIHSYTDKMTEYQTTLQSTVAQLNETTDRNRELQESISHLLDKMTAERTTFDQLFEKHMDRLNDNVEDITAQSERQSQLVSQYEQLMVQVNGHLQESASSAEANQKLSSTLFELAEKVSNMNKSLQSILIDFKETGEQYQLFQKQTTTLLSKVQDERDKVAHISQEVTRRLDKELKAMDYRTDKLGELWTNSHRVLRETNEQLSSSMNQFAEHMHQGLERTFAQFDRELSKAVQYLQNGIEAMEDVIDELPDGIEKLGHYIQRINEQAEKLTKEA